MAFELVEVIDENYARSFHGPSRLEKAFKDVLNKQPQKKKQFEVNFNNALMIIVAFNEKISFLRKKNSVPKIINYLLTLEKTAEGKFGPKGLDTVKHILVDRGEFKGRPKIEVDRWGVWIHDPCKDNIQSKFEKNYKISSRTELLAYYKLHPHLHENHLFHECKKFIIEHIKKSVFQRVWIYSVRENEIVFVYPNL